LPTLVKKDLDPPDVKDGRNLCSFATLCNDYLKWYKENRKEDSFNTMSGHLITSFFEQAYLNIAAADLRPTCAEKSFTQFITLRPKIAPLL
jgi:hypothetical protein